MSSDRAMRYRVASNTSYVSQFIKIFLEPRHAAISLLA
jgi:hypothetical protein